MATRLQQIVTAAGVAPGATAVITHKLNVVGKPVIPDRITRSNTGFAGVAATSTTVTVRNDTQVAADIALYLRYYHTQDRVYGNAAVQQLTPAPFWDDGASASIPGILTGQFATFDPAVDGLDAYVGTVWAATDCPMRKVKASDDPKGWSIEGEGEAVFAACRTASEIQALYRGLARQPALDMAPAHLLIPDPVNNRVSDLVAGDHLTIQGLGAGATISRSPLGDGLGPDGWEAASLNGNTSYFAATSNTAYDIKTEDFVIGFLWSTTRNAQGAITFGKYADPALAGLGYGVSSNGGGQFGFLLNGALGNVNTDTYSAPRVDDGQIRLFHFGRDTAGAGQGFVRNASAIASQAGQPGTLTNTAIFGILNDTGAVRSAVGDQQFYAIAFWTGTAAANVKAYLSAVEKGLASAREINPALFPPDYATVRTPAPARALGVAFQPNALRPTWCSYTVEYGSGGTSTAYVALKCDPVNPPTTVRARSGGGVGVAIVVIVTGQVSFLVPAGWYVKLDQIDVAAGGTCTLREQVEITL